MRSCLIVLFSLFLLACGSKTPVPGDGGAADFASSPSGCQVRTDCRLFSSYCRSAPCQCLAVGRADPDPSCDTGTQTCLVDPCLNKSADCQGGVCVIAP
jgi:hypothetical protein